MLKRRMNSPRFPRGVSSKIGHHNIAVEFNGVDVYRMDKFFKEDISVMVVLEDRFLFIPPTGNMVYGIGILYSKRSCHIRGLAYFVESVNVEDLTPFSSPLEPFPWKP